MKTYTVGIFAATKPDLDLSVLAQSDEPRLRFEVFRGMTYEPCDIAVYFGSEKRAMSERQKLRHDINVTHKGPVLRSEVGFLGRKNIPRPFDWMSPFRKRNRRIAEFAHSYYRFGINGIFPDEAELLNEHSPADRWTLLRRDLNLELKPYKRDGRHILLVGQTPGDASLKGIDMDSWLVETAQEIRRRTARPILFRAHPGIRSQSYEAIAARLKQIPNVEAAPHTANARPKDLAEAFAVCCYSSGFALDALLAGIPVVALSDRNIVWRYCSNTIDEIESPRMPDREQIFCDIAYLQWSYAEMRDGLVIRHYAPRLIELCDARQDQVV